MTDAHQIPWGMPGPDDPVERARATAIELDGDHFRLVRPTESSHDGIPEELRHPEGLLAGGFFPPVATKLTQSPWSLKTPQNRQVSFGKGCCTRDR